MKREGIKDKVCKCGTLIRRDSTMCRACHRAEINAQNFRIPKRNATKIWRAE